MKLLQSLIFISLSFTFLTTGCSKNDSSLKGKSPNPEIQGVNPEASGFATNPDTVGKQHSPWFESYHQGLVQRLQNFTVQCEENCPPSVGTFVGFKKINSKNEKEYNACGAAIYTDKLAITARHCLAMDNIEKGMSCEGMGHFIFPATADLPARVIQCSEIEDFSVATWEEDKDDIQEHADWVILKMAESAPKRMVKINREGLGDQHLLYLFKPLYDVENNTIDILRIKCENRLDTYGVPTSRNPFTPINHVKCDRLLSEGYSGSVYYNNYNEIMGVNSQNLYHEDDKVRKHSKNAAISNIACVRVDPNDKELVAKCTLVEEKIVPKRKRLRARFLKEQSKQSKKLITDWLARSPEHPVKWSPIDLKKIHKLPKSWRSRFGGISEPECATETFQDTPLPFPEDLRIKKKSREVSSDEKKSKNSPKKNPGVSKQTSKKKKETPPKNSTPLDKCDPLNSWNQYLKEKVTDLKDLSLLTGKDKKKAIQSRRALFREWRASRLEPHYERMTNLFFAPMVPTCINTNVLKQKGFNPKFIKTYTIAIPSIYGYIGISWDTDKLVSAINFQEAGGQLTYNPETKLFRMEMTYQPPVPSAEKMDLLNSGRFFEGLDIPLCQ